MPTWVVLVALIAGPGAVGIVGARLGMHPATMNSAIWAAAALPLTVLVSGWLADTWGLPIPTPLWAQVLLLIGAPASIISTMLWTSRQAARADAAANTPAGRCSRCHADLFADHTGRRYFARDEGYLCPPERRAPGDRRHHAVLIRIPGTL